MRKALKQGFLHWVNTEGFRTCFYCFIVGGQIQEGRGYCTGRVPCQ